MHSLVANNRGLLCKNVLLPWLCNQKLSFYFYVSVVIDSINIYMSDNLPMQTLTAKKQDFARIFPYILNKKNKKMP